MSLCSKDNPLILFIGNVNEKLTFFIFLGKVSYEINNVSALDGKKLHILKHSQTLSLFQLPTCLFKRNIQTIPPPVYPSQKRSET
jgi:hypothetical protein